MKLTFTLPLFLFFSIFSAAQLPCLPDAGGVLASDEPPGCLLCDQIYAGSTAGFTKESFDYEFLCGEIENSQWISVKANKFGFVDVNLVLDSCQNSNGIQMALYDKNFNKKGPCISSNSIGNSLNLRTNALEPYEEYWLMIDGQLGDICGFTIANSSRYLTIVNLITSSDGNRRETCLGGQVCYNVNRDTNVIRIDWNTTGGNILSGGQSGDASICIEFNRLGNQRIEVEMEYKCNNFIRGVYDVQVNSSPIFTEDIIMERCPGEFPLEYHGTQINSFGQSTIILQTAAGCDSVYNYFISEKIDSHLNTYRVCENDTLFIDTAQITTSGTYRFFYPGGNVLQCDSIHVATVEIVDTSAPKISCVIDTFINALGIIWNENPHVDFYRLTLNDTSIFLSDRRSYLYQTNISNEVVEVSVKPFSDYCLHHEAKLTCVAPPLTTNIQDLEEIQLEVYPNPSTGNFKILSRNAIEKIEVFDLSGKRILIENSSEIDLKDFDAGIYFFKIFTSTGSILKKVFKKD